MSGTSTPFIFTGGGQVIKSSAATLYGIDGMAPDSGFLQVYNKASAPVIGMDIPVATLPVLGGQRVSYPMPEGMILSNGLAAIFTRYVVPDAANVINDAAVLLFRFA